MEKIYNEVVIKSLKEETLFLANKVTVRDALNGYAATYDYKNTEELVMDIGSIFLKE